MPPALAGSLVFGASAAVLVLEIMAARLLAPHVGTSIETYTGIIGVVLAGIAGGTWLGGRLADRVGAARLLGPLLAVGGLLALAADPVVDGLAASVPGGGPGSIVTLAAAAFLAPAAVLSAVHPAVVKLQLGDLAHTGTVVGRLSALSTAGAIAGTVVTGLVLVALVPSPTVTAALGGALVVAGGALHLWLRGPGAGTRPSPARPGPAL